MTSKFIYKVIRIKAGFVPIIIIYNCSKDRKKKIQNHYYLTDRQFGTLYVVISVLSYL